MREREEVEFAWRYRRWRALILATRGRESQGGRGELGTCSPVSRLSLLFVWCYVKGTRILIRDI